MANWATPVRFNPSPGNAKVSYASENLSHSILKIVVEEPGAVTVSSFARGDACVLELGTRPVRIDEILGVRLSDGPLIRRAATRVAFTTRTEEKLDLQYLACEHNVCDQVVTHLRAAGDHSVRLAIPAWVDVTERFRAQDDSPVGYHGFREQRRDIWGIRPNGHRDCGVRVLGRQVGAGRKDRQSNYGLLVPFVRFAFDDPPGGGWRRARLVAG